MGDEKTDFYFGGGGFLYDFLAGDGPLGVRIE